jgi:nicotinamide riboside transporter PnuC
LQMEDNVLLFGHEDEFPEVFWDTELLTKKYTCIYVYMYIYICNVHTWAQTRQEKAPKWHFYSPVTCICW